MEVRMAYDEELAARVRLLLIGRQGYSERKMFGGICFMLHGNMACGVIRDQLISRVGPERYIEALERPHATVFDFTGRPMKGWVQVSPEGWIEDGNLQKWVQLGIDYSLTFPPKQKR